MVNPSKKNHSTQKTTYKGFSRDYLLSLAKFTINQPLDTIWVFPKIGTPKWMVKIMENPIKMDDLGAKPTISGSTHFCLNQKHTKHHLHRIHSCLPSPPPNGTPTGGAMVTPLVLCDFLGGNVDDEGKDLEDGNWYQKQYPPANSHIPPGEKENHLQKCHFLGIC